MDSTIKEKVITVNPKSFKNPKINSKTGETFDNFIERMSKVEKEKEVQFGMRHQGCFRAIFQFESENCLLETFGFYQYDRNYNVNVLQRCLKTLYNPPKFQWVHCYLIYGKERANKIKEYYGAKRIDEDPYPREEGVWFSLVFEEFEDLMKIVWDMYTGYFLKIFGEEPKKYESCFSYLGEDQ